MDPTLAILIMLLLLLLEGFFSGSEIALVHADKLRLRARAGKGDRGAQVALRLFERPEVLLTTTLVGTNIAVVTLTTLGTLLLIDRFGPLGELYAFLLLTPILLVFGEIVPKSVYQQKADALAPVVVYPLRAFSLVLYPVVWLFSLVARAAARIAGGPRSASSLFITRQQVATLVDMADRGADVDVFDRKRIERAIRFGSTTVGEAMVPLAEITALNHLRSTRDAAELVRQSGFNRLPVYEGNIGNVIGIVTLTVWDLMDESVRAQPLGELLRPALYCSPLQPIDDLLPLLRERDDHMAVVVDEFGSAIGMITMEDILEEVVGEIEVGYDFDVYRPKRKRHFQRMDDGLYVFDSRVPISELNALLGIDLPATEFHTAGGFIETRLRRIPRVGDGVSEAGWRFTVIEADERAVIKLRIERG
ncbi:HlyC/CorC family transporter [Thiohalocapsa marina]|uniref:HlyC/CorC family transporter n=1 Tax=Thiohalocapsa marina TaxID=424902 RepID=A0A5M8FKT9_9GAMM|nr:hemolysin family protein [Thiohalocapsa marina]KAA6184600.1 HlyC/CorC family transporter [Thiohalocapsa marina]